MSAHQVEVDLEAAVPGAGGPPRPPASRAPQRRLSFRLNVALVWVGIFGLMALFFAFAKFDWGWMRDNFRFIATGLWVTVVTAIAAITLALVLALLGALGRLSKNPVAYGLSGFYTSFFRGTPLILQLFLWYLALPQVAGNLYNGGHLPKALYTVTLLSPVMAGILAVGPGQTEAADALGMTYRQRMRRVVLPQAFKIVIPPTGNEFIAMMKDTALVAFLGAPVFYWDLFKRAQTLGSQAFKPLEALIVAAGLYWALTALFSFFQARLERRMSRGYVRQALEPRNKRWVSGASAGAPGGGAMMVEVPEQGESGEGRTP